jgi:hypothetical protein
MTPDECKWLVDFLCKEVERHVHLIYAPPDPDPRVNIQRESVSQQACTAARDGVFQAIDALAAQGARHET